MLKGSVEICCAQRLHSLPSPEVDVVLGDRAYNDDYLFESLDTAKTKPPSKSKRSPPLEVTEDLLPKMGGHKFAPTLKKR